MTIHSLLTLWMTPFKRQYWYYVERHALMSADVEAKRANEASHNVRYFQTRAAIARSEQNRLRF